MFPNALHNEDAFACSGGGSIMCVGVCMWACAGLAVGGYLRQSIVYVDIVQHAGFGCTLRK